jgi:hypothetical protein
VWLGYWSMGYVGVRGLLGYGIRWYSWVTEVWDTLV